MASEEAQKYYLKHAIRGLEIADMYLKRSNGADQLCTGLVCDCWTYEEMIEHLIVGIKLIFEGEGSDSPEASTHYTVKNEATARMILELKQGGATMKDIQEMFGEDIAVPVENDNCDHYWVWFKRTNNYRCVRCDIPQNVDCKTMDINNRNVERCG